MPAAGVPWLLLQRPVIPRGDGPESTPESELLRSSCFLGRIKSLVVRVFLEVPRHPGPNHEEIHVLIPEVDRAEGALVAIGPGDIEGDRLPGDPGAEGALRDGGELLTVFRSVDAVQADLQLPVASGEQCDRVAV